MVFKYFGQKSWRCPAVPTPLIPLDENNIGRLEKCFSIYKMEESAVAALDQVKKKGYDAPYRGRGLPIWLIGLNFDRQSRHLLEAKAVRFSYMGADGTL